MVCVLKSMKGQTWGRELVQITKSFNIQKAKCCWSGALPSGHGGGLAGLGE